MFSRIIIIINHAKLSFIYIQRFNVNYTYIYWTILDFEQSTGPAIDCQMMDLLYHECLVHHHHYYCNRVRDAIQRNVVFLYGYHYLKPIDRSTDRLFPNGLTWFQLIPIHTCENAALHSLICILWFILFIVDFVLFVSLFVAMLSFSSGKVKKNWRKKAFKYWELLLKSYK